MCSYYSQFFNYQFFTFSFVTSPPCVIQVPFTRSSSQFRFNSPVLVDINARKFRIFFPYNLLASDGMVLCKLLLPTMLTPLCINVSLFLVNGVLPPVDA